jgi:MFS family permease
MVERNRLGRVRRFWGGRLGARFGPERVGGVGAALFATGGLWLAGLLGDEVSYATTFLPAQLLVGVGVGLTIPTLVAIALGEMPPTRFSTGTAVYSAFRQIGTALGVAVWLAVLGTASLTNASSYASGWVVITAIAAAASVAVLSTPRRASAESPATPGKAAVVTTGGYGEERLSESAGSSVSKDRTT